MTIDHTSWTFGAHDRPPCRRCGSKTEIVHRRPHPTLGPQYELQTFACSNCGITQERDADENGALSELR